jgi:EAL domain-containing protein (putative c-di-GMP-specific phosphodiesterase class I)/CheY-like chemotaxis protein
MMAQNEAICGTHAAAAEPIAILLVDDDACVRSAYGRVLRRAGYRVTTAADGLEAVDLLGTCACDVVVSDVDMPGMDGIELLRQVRDFDPDLQVLLVTGSPSLDSAIRAVEHGAARYLAKPITTPSLIVAVDKAATATREARCARLSLARVESESQREIEEREELRSSFTSAVAGLFMAFQPIVGTSEMRIHGYEALLRTTFAPLANPMAFIEAAEKLGALHLLGRAARAAAAEAFAAAAPPDALLFVNLHPEDLGDPELYERDTELGRIASRVVLEITERASLQQISDLRDRVTRLRALGYRMAVDDLGAGYAALSAVALLEPEIFKLDMSLVRDVDATPTKQRLVRSLVVLAAELRSLAVVEGVETAAERDCLRDLGCDLMQGYHFARPAREIALTLPLR